MTRAPQGRGDALIKHPTHRQMYHALAEASLGEPIEPAHRRQVLRKARLEELGVVAPHNVAVKNRVRLHSSRQQAAAELDITQPRYVVVPAIGVAAPLDSAPRTRAGS